MKFTKMQGAGNDFIIIDNTKGQIPEKKYPELARRVCARRLSLGADGLMVVERPREGGDLRMAFFNSDGSVGEMCGNGARCISRYGLEHGFASGDTIRVETTAGMVTGRRVSKRLFTVRLNDPTVTDLQRVVDLEGQRYMCSYLELGSPGIPHAVFLYEGWQRIPEDDLRELCRKLRRHPSFPRGANVTFCSMDGPDSVVARTFERGVEDFTLACGTGCGSTAAALTLRGLASGKNVKISMPGGTLYVTLTVEDGAARDILLTGPTNIVATGELTDEDMQ